MPLTLQNCVQSDKQKQYFNEKKFLGSNFLLPPFPSARDMRFSGGKFASTLLISDLAYYYMQFQ